MTHPKKGGHFVKGFCMDCKKWRDLQDHQGLKLCDECEEKFLEPLIKLHENQQYGQDIVEDNKKKKED